MLQLNPPIPVVTPKGKALAIAWIDYGIEHDLMWVCLNDSNGECWTWKTPEIRAQINITQQRDYISPFYDPEDVSFNKDSKTASQQSDEEGVLAYEWEGKVILSNDVRWTPWSHSMPGEGKFLFKDYNGKIFEGEHRASKLRGGSYILLPPEFDGWKIDCWYQEEKEWKRP